MTLLREKTIFGISVALGMISFALMGLISSKKAEIENELTSRGFHRTAVISASGGDAEVYGADAANLIANGPRASDGVRSLLSRVDAGTLRAMPAIATVMTVGKSNGQIKLPNGLTSAVTVFNVPPEFVDVFRLGDASLLREGDYVPSGSLKERLRVSAEPMSGTLGIPEDIIEALPTAMRDKLDWSKAKYAIRLLGQSYDLPHGAPLFDDAIFTTGREQKFSVPGISVLPSVSLFVRLKDDVELNAAMGHLQEFVERARPADSKMKLGMATMSQYFAEELGLTMLADWFGRALAGLMCLSVLLLTLLAFVRHARIRQEVALREATGATPHQAVWLSVRHAVYGLSAGMAIGAALGGLAVIAAFRADLGALLPVAAALVAVALAANLLLVGSARLLCASGGMARLAP